MEPMRAFLIIWLIWWSSWIAAGLLQKRKKTENRPSLKSDIGYRLLTTPGFILAYLPVAALLGDAQLSVSASRSLQWILVAVCFLALAFTWWARIKLGKEWSPGVTQKAEHEICSTGPYSIVRHPMYVGIIIGLFSLAFAKGTFWALAGATLVVVGFWKKSRLEEKFLSEYLPADAYGDYKRRVPMLVPKIVLGR